MQLYGTKNKAVQYVSIIFMMMTLLWLTVSVPFVYAGQQDLAKQQLGATDSPLTENEEDSTNPFGNSTEEKAPSSNSFSEEYLHEHTVNGHLFSSRLQYYKCDDAEAYIAYHGELLVPPPNFAS